MMRLLAGAILSISLTSCLIEGEQAIPDRIERTKQTIRLACEAVERFRTDQGKLPRSWMELVTAGYLKEPVKDAWGNYLVYDLYNGVGPHGRPFEIASFGEDGEKGGQGEAADIWSYEILASKLSAGRK